jgi:hypothetical protein
MPDFKTLYNLSRELSSAAWLIYSLCYLILALAMARVARIKTGSIFRWPLPGRWLLVLHYISILLVFTELTLVFLVPRWFDVRFGDRGIMIMSYLSLIPLIFFPWLIKRLIVEGLTDGVK